MKSFHDSLLVALGALALTTAVSSSSEYARAEVAAASVPARIAEDAQAPMKQQAADNPQDKADKNKDKKDNSKDKTDSSKDKTDNGGNGGAGVGPPTVHGCNGSGCWNNPPEPRPPQARRCKKEKGIEICTP